MVRLLNVWSDATQNNVVAEGVCRVASPGKRFHDCAYSIFYHYYLFMSILHVILESMIMLLKVANEKVRNINGL